MGRSSVMLTRCEMGRKRDAGSRGSCVGVVCFLVERITFTHTLVLLVHLRGKRPRHGRDRATARREMREGGDGAREREPERRSGRGVGGA